MLVSLSNRGSPFVYSQRDSDDEAKSLCRREQIGVVGQNGLW